MQGSCWPLKWGRGGGNKDAGVHGGQHQSLKLASTEEGDQYLFQAEEPAIWWHTPIANKEDMKTNCPSSEITAINNQSDPT